MMRGLIYIGRGYWLPGIPARDLSLEETERLGRARLLATGLYIEVEVDIEIGEFLNDGISADEEE